MAPNVITNECYCNYTWISNKCCTGCSCIISSSKGWIGMKLAQLQPKNPICTNPQEWNTHNFSLQLLSHFRLSCISIYLSNHQRYASITGVTGNMYCVQLTTRGFMALISGHVGVGRSGLVSTVRACNCIHHKIIHVDIHQIQNRWYFMEWQKRRHAWLQHSRELLVASACDYWVRIQGRYARILLYQTRLQQDFDT